MDFFTPFWIIGVFIGIIIYVNDKKFRSLHKRIEDPENHEDYLRLFCYVYEKSAHELFHIAGEGIPKYMIESDWKKYLRELTIPSYVKEFLDEGKETLDSAEILPFTYFP